MHAGQMQLTYLLAVWMSPNIEVRVHMTWPEHFLLAKIRRRRDQQTVFGASVIQNRHG